VTGELQAHVFMFTRGEKNHLFLLEITAGIRAPELRVFPFKATTAAHVPHIYFAAIVNGAFRSAVSDRSGTSDLKNKKRFGSRNTRPYI
jgi:hypothetical protein